MIYHLIGQLSLFSKKIYVCVTSFFIVVTLSWCSKPWIWATSNLNLDTAFYLCMTKDRFRITKLFVSMFFIKSWNHNLFYIFGYIPTSYKSAYLPIFFQFSCKTPQSFRLQTNLFPAAKQKRKDRLFEHNYFMNMHSKVH